MLEIWLCLAVHIHERGVGIVWTERPKVTNFRNTIVPNRTVTLDNVHWLAEGKIVEESAGKKIVRQQTDSALLGGQPELSQRIRKDGNVRGRLGRLLDDWQREAVGA